VAAEGEGRGIEELVAFRMQSAYGSKEPGSCIGEKDAVKKCKVTHIFFIRPRRLARVPAKREKKKWRRGGEMRNEKRTPPGWGKDGGAEGEKKSLVIAG